MTTTDVNGCPGNDEFTISALPQPLIVASANPSTISAGSVCQLSLQSDMPIETFSWAPPESLNSPRVKDPIASPQESTSYTVIAQARGVCPAVANVDVIVIGNMKFTPAFSPNNDGIDDVWDIKVSYKPECTLTIFDAHGRKVFEAKGENWDGTYQGKPVPAGTYYYVFACPTTSDNTTGAVLVMK